MKTLSKSNFNLNEYIRGPDSCENPKTNIFVVPDTTC